jgi:hypothetical protein
MLLLHLVLVLTSSLAAAADLSPAALVGRLASPDRVVREEAARTLEERGSEALPPLRAARDGARDPEARERFADLIARVEARLLERPTTVVLDVDDRPLGEALQALSTRSGYSLLLDDPVLAARRVTVRASSPVPFWEAVDLLGHAGHVRHDPGQRGDAPARDPRTSVIHLVDGNPPPFTTYSGPVRIHLFATHRHRDRNFERNEFSGVPQHSATVTVEVQAFVEPGRFLNGNGQVHLEAVDAQARAISPQGLGPGDPPGWRASSWLIPGTISARQWHVPLGLPDLPRGSPLKLRGVLPVVISSRRPDPLVIPLTGADGRTFRQGPKVVRIEKISAQGADAAAIELSLSEDVIPEDRPRIRLGAETDFVGDFLANRLEFEDAEGRLLTWLLVGDPAATATNNEIQVRTFVSGAARPALLRVYRLHRVATKLPFEFADVPSP